MPRRPPAAAQAAAFVALAAALLVARAGDARAAGGTSASGASGAGERASPIGPIPPWFIPEGEPMKTAAIEANPLGLAIGLFSANLEYVFRPHSAVVLSPHYYFAVPGVSDQLTGGGVELGYRYYTGLYGPHGFFLGGSLTYGAYRYVHRVPFDTTGLDLPDDTSYDALGGAVDAGYQILLHEHIVVGAGAGLMYRYFDAQPTFETYQHGLHELLYGSGLRPRVLLSFGGAI
jgi:hypothetical protein